MTSSRDTFSDLAYLVNWDFVQPEPIEETPEPGQEQHEQKNEQEGEQQDGFARDSVAESVIIPRESMFGPPPPVPPKDTPRNSMAYEIRTSLPFELPTAPSSNPCLFETLGEKEDCQQQEMQRKDSSWLVRQSSSTSSEIDMHLPMSPLEALDMTTASTLAPNLNTLMASPPSPSSAGFPQMPKMSHRPGRPSSLPLAATLTVYRKERLRASVVVVLNPQRPCSHRTGTANSYTTQPHTGYTASSRTKYGHGMNATTELIPQPSDDSRDPLNWQAWRKELHLYALLMSVALCNSMKMALVSVNSILAERLAVSYIAVSALTGVPLMLSAVTGLASCTVSKKWGRRPAYLMSMVLIFIGLVWNTQITTSYAQFMAARIFQGLGWGAFDTMVISSIMDTYFEHERATKTAIYRIVSVATTWGPPLLGGLVSQSARGSTLQFEILALLQVLSIPLIVFGAPESMYDRSDSLLEKSTTPGWTPRTGWSSLGLCQNLPFSRLPAWAKGRGTNIEKAVQYIKDVGAPQSYTGANDHFPFFQTAGALVAPTTVLAFLASFLPYSLLWGFSSSLSGLFARSPFNLFPATVGLLLTTPFILATATVALFSLWPAWSKTNEAFRIRTYLLVLAAGAALSLTGILTDGLFINQWLLNSAGQGVDFTALSVVLGLLAAGAYVLDASRQPLIQRSTRFTSPNLAVGRRYEADMDAGVTVWSTLLAGVFVMATPAVVLASADGLRGMEIGVAVAQVFVAAAVGLVWVMYDEKIMKIDGRMLGCVDLTYFDNFVDHAQAGRYVEVLD